ncbi:hypothetical protein [Amycolatopsis sp. NPDC051716]|uniref:hypothetical protein n=1 Tax=Amycolatopsis sp. NPDC051716 TaxID=3155804 RepID=UPI0034466206
MRALRLIRRIAMFTSYPPQSLPGWEEKIRQKKVKCPRRGCKTTLELVDGEPYCPTCAQAVKLTDGGPAK